MRNILIIGITTIMSIVVLFLILVYGFGFLQRETADFRGKTDQIKQTEANSVYRISSYDQFYDKCASIKSLESKIGNMKDELKDADDTQRKTTLNTSITASENKRAELINSYNADARKEDTRGKFKASDLPYELDIGEETTCESY